MKDPQAASEAIDHDLMTIVGPSGAPYYCPDAQAFEDHVAGLWNRLYHARSFPDVARSVRADIRALLECRELLEMVAY